MIYLEKWTNLVSLLKRTYEGINKEVNKKEE